MYNIWGCRLTMIYNITIIYYGVILITACIAQFTKAADTQAVVCGDKHPPDQLNLSYDNI